MKKFFYTENKKKALSLSKKKGYRMIKKLDWDAIWFLLDMGWIELKIDTKKNVINIINTY